MQERSGGDIKAPSLSRWENGERSVRPTDLRLLLDIYDVQGERRETLLTLSRQAKERGWWQSYASAIPEWFQAYVGLEAEASSVHVYESELVDGLLQTADYYRAFLRAAPAAADAGEADRKIEVRLARQERRMIVPWRLGSARYASRSWRAERALGPGEGGRGPGNRKPGFGGFPGFPGSLQASAISE